MKLLAFSVLLLCGQVFAAKKTPYTWELNEGVDTPESVYYHRASDSLFSSHIVGAGDKADGKGHISLHHNDGKYKKQKWVDGLNAPKGMRATKDTLWVSDIDQVHSIDIKTAKIKNSYAINGAKFLNDIAIDKKGAVYISDTLTSKIHKIENGKVTEFLTGDNLASPNGLLVIDNDLIVAAWGLTTDWSTKIPGHLYKVDLKNKKITNISKPLGNLDGLEVDSKGNYIVSDWVSGKIYKVTSDGKSTLLYTGVQGVADIGYIAKTKQILIPYMKDGYIRAIKYKH